MRSTTRCAALAIGLALTGCRSTYYSAMERLGYEKRDLLVERVEEARDGQEAAKVEFRDALEQFRSVVRVDGGDLEKKYDEISSAYDDAEARAREVRERVAAVRRVGGDLFAEWEDEIDEISDAGLRARSAALRAESERRYERMLAAMTRAEQSMAPVLERMRDQVLFLKHNLNARAVAALRTNLDEIETDVGALIREMEKSIAEANTFISTMDAGAAHTPVLPRPVRC
jgi:hypothetical protein